MQLESSLGEETLDDPLLEFRTPSMETTFVSEIPSACEMEEGVVVAPSEVKKPVSIFNKKILRGAWSSTSVSYWSIWLQS